jgi:hypothetical protein
VKNSRQVIQCPKEKGQALIVEEQPTGNTMPERKKTNNDLQQHRELKIEQNESQY